MTKCKICGKDGFHKMSCPNNNARQKRLFVDIMQVNDKNGLSTDKLTKIEKSQPIN